MKKKKQNKKSFGQTVPVFSSDRGDIGNRSVKNKIKQRENLEYCTFVNTKKELN